MIDSGAFVQIINRNASYQELKPLKNMLIELQPEYSVTTSGKYW